MVSHFNVLSTEFSSLDDSGPGYEARGSFVSE
jgi:hypothetical protein